MTRTERGQRGGIVSSQRAVLRVRGAARARALAAIDAADPAARPGLVALLEAGGLDGWLVVIERLSYRRGYCARDEKLRRDTAAAERARVLSAARETYAGVPA